MEIDRAFQLIDDIETTMADSIDGRFLHPDILKTLDNVNASRKEIDLLYAVAIAIIGAITKKLITICLL